MEAQLTANTYRAKPDIIAVWYDIVTGEYLCSKHPFDTADEAVADMEGDRYDLVETIILKTI